VAQGHNRREHQEELTFRAPIGAVMSRVRTGKYFWSGAMFLCFAAVGLYVSRNYAMGSSGEMGPRYFPLLLGVLLGAIGLLLIARSLINGDEPIEDWGLRALLLVVVGVVLFGLCIQPLGLVLSVAITVVVVAFAGRGSNAIEIGLLAAALVILSAGIFHFALQLPLALWPSL
jgi:hypothetical protein